MRKLTLDKRTTKHRDLIRRLGAHKRRTLDMAGYVASLDDVRSENISTRLHSCHTYLLFHNHFLEGKIRLHRTVSCHMHLLCPLCAITRAANGIQRYHERCEIVRQENPGLRAYYLVFTVRNLLGATLHGQFEHCVGHVRKLIERRRAALSARKGNKQFAYALDSVLANVTGGCYSIEVKRGKNSGEWHPHVNMLLLSPVPIDVHQLWAEWGDITIDSTNVHCEEKDPSDMKVWLEIMKYSMKFSEMNLPDNWHAYDVLNRRNLLGTFGAFRGIEVSDDPSCDIESPYVEMFYRWYQNRYEREQTVDEIDSERLLCTPKPSTLLTF